MLIAIEDFTKLALPCNVVPNGDSYINTPQVFGIKLVII